MLRLDAALWSAAAMKRFLLQARLPIAREVLAAHFLRLQQIQFQIPWSEYIVEYLKEITRVGTIKGVVSMSSIQNKESIDINPGKMSSVDSDGTVLPIKAFSGEMMRDFEFAGERMNSNEASGEKIDLN